MENAEEEKKVEQKYSVAEDRCSESEKRKFNKSYEAFLKSQGCITINDPGLLL